jgi:acetyl-CoA decarbonylase/synthase complex subunit delta
MNLGSAAAGYGYEYVASTMDRVKAAALAQNDAMLQMPIVTPVGGEAWSVKEAIVSEEDFPEWGPTEQRGIDMEITTAVADIASGSNAVILRHPVSVSVVKKLISELVPTDLVPTNLV